VEGRSRDPFCDTALAFIRTDWGRCTNLDGPIFEPEYKAKANGQLARSGNDIAI